MKPFNIVKVVYLMRLRTKKLKQTDDDDNKVAEVNKRFCMTTTKHVMLVLGCLVLLKWIR